ncbi:MAG TPA: hypothetical protein VK120_06825 [Sporosarcina sp.]|nr:hypothetical protein [Sporosarcina sp.]
MILFWSLFQLLIEESLQEELLPIFKLAIALYLLQFALRIL